VNNVRRSSNRGGSDQLLVKTRRLTKCKKNPRFPDIIPIIAFYRKIEKHTLFISGSKAYKEFCIHYNVL